MNDAAASPVASTLQARLRGGQFVMTAEVAPPVSCDAQDLLRKAAPLKGLADAVNVTDGAGARAHMGALAAAAILIGAGIEPILQLACRDRNRIALQGDLMGAAALGVRNLLMLTGDDPKAGDQPDTKPVFDIDSTDADRHRAQAARRRANCRPAARSRAAPHFSSAPPTCRSTRSRTGSRRRSPARSRRARSSRRRNSAWIPAIVRRYVGAARRARD